MKPPVSVHQRNEMYRQARGLREEIRHGLITKSQHWNPSDSNVKEFMAREGSKGMAEKISLFKSIMKNVGADPKDWDIEKLRGVR